jgi:hypothetical protein
MEYNNTGLNKSIGRFIYGGLLYNPMWYFKIHGKKKNLQNKSLLSIGYFFDTKQHRIRKIPKGVKIIQDSDYNLSIKDEKVSDTTLREVAKLKTKLKKLGLRCRKLDKEYCSMFDMVQQAGNTWEKRGEADEESRDIYNKLHKKWRIVGLKFEKARKEYDRVMEEITLK